MDEQQVKALISDAIRADTTAENERSRHRNMNRLTVTGAAWLLSTLVPVIAHIFRMPAIAGYGASAGFGASILIVIYAWRKEY